MSKLFEEWWKTVVWEFNEDHTRAMIAHKAWQECRARALVLFKDHVRKGY